MPPPRDPNAPPSKNRRRPEVMPGGWLWLVLLILLVLVMLFFVVGNTSGVDYSEVKKLAEAGKTETGNNIIKRAAISGTDRIQRELQDDWRRYAGGEKTDPKFEKEKSRLEAIAKKIRGNKFSCYLPESVVRGVDSVTAMLDSNNVT